MQYEVNLIVNKNNVLWIITNPHDMHTCTNETCADDIKINFNQVYLSFFSNVLLV